MSLARHGKWLVALCLPLALKLGDVWLIRLSAEGAESPIDLALLPRQVGGWTGVDAPVPTAEVEGLGRKAVVERNYSYGDRPTINTAFIYSNKREGLHLPQNCLVSQGWTLLRETTVEIPYDSARRTATVNLVVAVNPHRRTVVQEYVFVDASRTATGWGRQYLDMIRYGRAGGKMTCLLLLTAVAPREEYGETQADLSMLMQNLVPWVHRSLGG